ncbi:MAG: MFS transporter [Campylobacterales bacterium]|nr:MFS transporter [Campylobacterales bacterium]
MSYLLSIFYFFYFSIIGVYVIFLPKVLSMLGYGASDIGVIFAAGPMVRFLLPFSFTKFFKLNRTTFNVALVLMIVGTIAFYLGKGYFYILLVSNIILSVGLSLVLPYIEVVALEHIGKEKYGKVRLFGSVGFVLVALVLVKFLNSADTAFLFLTTLTFLTTTFAYIIIRSEQEILQTKDENLSHTNGDIAILKDIKLWIGLTLMQVSFGSFYNFFTIYETDHGVSIDMTIYLWSFGVFMEILMLYFQGKLLKLNLLFLLQIAAFATAIRWFLVFLYPQEIEVLFFTQSIHALSFALFHSAAISYLFHLYKDKKLAQQFFSGISYGLGGFLGALSAGYIYEYFASYLFLSSSILAFLSFVYLYLWDKEINNQRLGLH